ncbi:MAG TPA: CBS domain-containing protein [Stellaceae bacterium]|jgi:CBS domain-containing protein|nr:CBS domain-containing protein [Stellaceae bacterium]
MNVEAILKAKGREVATVAPDAAVSEAVRLLHSRGIGALVVSADGNRLDGIVSERDLVHALAQRGASVLDQRVSELMTRRVVTCTPNDTIAELMAEMTRRRIRHLPVVDRGHLVGLVSIGDLVKNRLEEMEFETTSLRQFIAGAA